jgi:3-dehydroquinate dehydratase-2
VASILIVNGPNLNLLGTREPDTYGRVTLADIEAGLRARFAGVDFAMLQSNHEGVLVDRIQQARGDGVDWIVINPGALTHTSVALRDALLGVAIPFTEVHLSNTYAREPFRHHSYLSDVARGVIVGLGAIGYELAVTAALAHLGAAP